MGAPRSGWSTGPRSAWTGPMVRQLLVTAVPRARSRRCGAACADAASGRSGHRLPPCGRRGADGLRQRRQPSLRGCARSSTGRPVDDAPLFGGAARSALLPANLILYVIGMVEAVRGSSRRPWLPCTSTRGPLQRRHRLRSHGVPGRRAGRPAALSRRGVPQRPAPCPFAVIRRRRAVPRGRPISAAASGSTDVSVRPGEIVASRNDGGRPRRRRRWSGTGRAGRGPRGPSRWSA